MKKFASIAVVACLLFGAAVYFANLNGVAPPPVPTPEPVTPTTPVQTKLSPVTQASAQGTLSINANSSQGYISSSETTSLYATLDINAIKHQSSKRPPLNVSIVIDRSGSMTGDKIVNAKLAAKQLVGLLSSQDRVSVVSYSSDVTVNFPSTFVTEVNRSRLVSAIDSIYVGGGTNLSGGFQAGLRQVQNWKNQSSLNRVILMSDGRANIGETRVNVLSNMVRQGLNQNVSLSTIGLGLDYNEDLMTAMANQGAGNYYFVHHASTIAGVFSQELKGLANSVARNTNVMVSLKDGVILEDLYGFPYKQNGNTILIPMAEFRSEQKKSILMKLKVAGQATPKREMFAATLQYTDVVNNDKSQTQALALSSVSSSDLNQITGSVNAAVVGRVQQVEVAQSMNAAMQAYEKGDADGANVIIERQQRKLRKARRRYKFNQKQEASFGRVDAELGGMAAAVKAAPSPASAPAKAMIKKKKARSNYILFDDTTF